MLRVFKLYSPVCPACSSTEGLWKMMCREFSNYAVFDEISVAEPEKILERYPSKEGFYADMIMNKFFLPIDLDTSLTKEEKEDLKSRGETKSYGMPCFVFINTEKPHEFSFMIGGVGAGYTYKDANEYIRDFRKEMLRLIRSRNIITYDEWLFRRQYQNPFSENAKKIEV